MKLSPLILFLLCGCDESQLSEVGGQKSDFRPPTSDVRLLVAPPPEFVLHFTYAQWPLANCSLESSTDLVHWETRDDFSVETNTDGIINWRLQPAPLKPREFFRIAGETIE